MTSAPRKSAGKRSRRKPITIDMEAGATPSADDLSAKDAPAAEPVAMEKKTEKTTSATKTPPAEPINPGRDQGDNTPEGASTSTRRATPTSGRQSSGLISGLVGGALALFGAAGLQWVGLIPNLGSASVDLTPVETELASLSLKIDDIQAQEMPDQSALVEELAASVAAVEATTAANSEVVGPLSARVDDMSASLAQLTTAVEVGEAGDGAAVETLTARIAGVDERISALTDDLAAISSGGGSAFDVGPMQERLAALESQSEEMAARIGETTDGVDAVRSETSGALDALSEKVEAVDSQLSSLAEQVAAGGADSSAVARAFAASGLKNAVDRGGSFASELEAFATVAEGGDTEAVETLRAFSASGVLTRAQLVEQYPRAANAIIGSERQLNPDAGLAERLVNNMQGLISVRPVDEQDGETPTAISTRIGARLSDGDLAAAIEEWEALPEVAKTASGDFVDQLKARHTVDQLLSDILAGAMSGTTIPAP